MGTQLTLNLDRRLTLNREDYFISYSNSLAIRTLDEWSVSPHLGLVIIGPKSSGKTHLASVWMNETGAKSFLISELESIDMGIFMQEQFIVLENLDVLSQLSEKEKVIIEEKIFHIYNLFSTCKGKILLTAKTVPSMWNIELKDLLSRLMSIQIAELNLPDDNLLAAIMSKQFMDRQILVSPQVIGHAIVRMERSFSFANKLVEDLDSEALSINKPINKKLVNNVICKLVSRKS